VHSASQSLGMESSADCILGKMCALCAARGRLGSFSVQVWVACMVEVLGRPTMMPLVVGWMFSTGQLLGRKWPVHPVSATAKVMVVCMLFDCWLSGVLLGREEFGICWFLVSACLRTGSFVFQHHQVLMRCICCWLPPSGLVTVAVYLCPTFLNRQLVPVCLLAISKLHGQQ
jgi:hypothetical protein